MFATATHMNYIKFLLWGTSYCHPITFCKEYTEDVVLMTSCSCPSAGGVDFICVCSCVF